MKGKHMNQLTRLIPATPISGFFLLPLVLALFTVTPTVQAVDPPPDGGYFKENTAEGTNALFSLTTGEANTASGFQALFNNTGGISNTANVLECAF
jgi:hypothetical protein